ncbi:MULTISPECIES: hypothetical protein [unclassified Ruminococcus]|uniref:hypothetical protein n=1 Tax=unclassified Ruminococcus TaxID=2608920 RepID=UPI00210DEB69|nr:MULTISPECIES: hypothetical protein [unclassified Ruminococcus]MCQ4022514.1 hypothetical protein [Ruminococcus sp. zg-924]MCQ4115143.1 hypothetical protein [Ruminococcus sp. zg-921]
MFFLTKLFKRNKSTDKITTDFDETGYTCLGCGRFNPMEYLFCPKCGLKRFESRAEPVVKDVENIAETPVTDNIRRMAALKKIGLLHLAHNLYQVNFQLESGKRVEITLMGMHNDDDALRNLRASGKLSYNKTYEIIDWPKANPRIGPGFNRVSACVCELPPNRVYHIKSLRRERLDREDYVTLYGCPNPNSINYDDIMNNLVIKVKDYEE